MHTEPAAGTWEQGSDCASVVQYGIVMSTGFQPIQPRKLYAKLLASGSSHERAQATLDFLCGCTGSARGHLFLVRDRSLHHVADSSQGSPAADLIAEAERAWSQELETEPDATRTRTIDLPSPLKPGAPLKDQLWTSASGGAYIRYVLGVYHSSRWTPIGVALLEVGAKQTPLRHAYIEAMCNAFIAAGDVPQLPVDSSLTS